MNLTIFLDSIGQEIVAAGPWWSHDTQIDNMQNNDYNISMKSFNEYSISVNSSHITICPHSTAE